MHSMTEGTPENPIVIVGCGLADGNAAVTLREEGFAGPVVIIGHEPAVPFGCPPLSKTYMRSEEALDGWYVRPAGRYADHDVERRGDAMAAVDPAAHTVTLDSGGELSYHKVLIATGGRNRRPAIPGVRPARDSLPANGSRVRRDQAGGSAGPTRGRRHGLHRM
jgi:3-phenylpropionate/trans-cinnamate dioxygenase ferredoxin reductase subunit